MKDEYIIINKTAIQKRIEELRILSNQPETCVYDIDVEGFILEELEQLLSQSTPLIPEIEKMIIDSFAEGHARFTDCGEFELEEKAEKFKIEYISNLKLDV